MRIVIVEDNKTNLMIMTRVASHVEDALVAPFSDAPAALKEVKENGCDLLIVDYMMPELDGLEFIRAIRANAATADIPAVMVTSQNDRAIRGAAIEAGATDFLTKPIDPVEIKARLRNLLLLRKAALKERDRMLELRIGIGEAVRTIAEREREMVLTLARAIEYRDGDTGMHVERVAGWARDIARRLGLDEAVAEDLYLAAPLHDIGKVAVPDAILAKPGPLSPEERAVMQLHTVQGHAILSDLRAPLLRKAATIALSHHERFDGAGYPHGLKGEDIPLEARIVADVYDALTSRRSYKTAWSRAAARDYLHQNAGTQFDPACVEAFLSLDPPPMQGRPTGADGFT